MGPYSPNNPKSKGYFDYLRQSSAPQYSPAAGYGAIDGNYTYQKGAGWVNPFTMPQSTVGGGQVLGAQTARPATSGQSAGGGGQAGAQTQAPQQDGYLDSLRSSFNSLRSSIGGQLPQLEGDYNTARSGVEGAQTRAKEVYGVRTGEIERGYGEGLRQLLQSDRELRARTKNVYSGLNALDSSAYADSQTKADQQLIDTQGGLVREKQSQMGDARRQYEEYDANVTQQLSALASQYMAGRQAIQQALAQNDLNEASQIQNYMQTLQQQAQQLQAVKMNLAQLQAQGVDVVGNLSKINRSGLDNIMGGYTQNFYNPMMGRLTSGAPQTPGTGYIGQSKKKDPYTGL